jgi:hypothetical protein
MKFPMKRVRACNALRSLNCFMNTPSFTFHGFWHLRIITGRYKKRLWLLNIPLDASISATNCHPTKIYELHVIKFCEITSKFHNIAAFVIIIIIITITIIITAIELSLSGSSSYTSTYKANRNKYT